MFRFLDTRDSVVGGNVVIIISQTDKSVIIRDYDRRNYKHDIFKQSIKSIFKNFERI